MKVETFEVTEIGTEGKMENFEECAQIVDKLGLEGQKELLNPEKKEVCPYRKMTAQELIVYGTLLTERTKLNKYSESAIPLRVLQVAAHATEIEICNFIEVWYQSNADIKDPLLVGVKGSEYSGERFILARWGEVLVPFIELIEKARMLIESKIKMSIVEAKEKLAIAEKTVKELAERAILTGQRTEVNIYIH